MEIISFAELRLKYNKETGCDWVDEKGNTTDEYVSWLENKLLDIGI